MCIRDRRLDKERSYEARGGLAKSQPSIIPGMIKFVEKEVQNHRNDNSYRLDFNKSRFEHEGRCNTEFFQELAKAMSEDEDIGVNPGGLE